MLLLRKIANGCEITWDSLDTEERRVLLYALVYLAVAALGAVQKLRQQRQQDARMVERRMIVGEVLAEVRRGGVLVEQ